ncbi:MAG: glutathione S-transferase family protein [Deltaproteobacteria bacterium]|nr:glutathione S-transferase family protein [Deltaproteobacteria bacterium]
MLKLYDNPFSPFARKVRLVLAYKGLPFERIDALALDRHDDLVRANPRAEVPALDDDGFIVVNSSHIVAYLEDRTPSPPVLPGDPKQRAAARSWERMADSLLDAVIHDISIWGWPTHHREDRPPEGLYEAGRSDLLGFMGTMESALGGEGFFCGELSVADFAIFPHVTALKPLGILFDAAAHPKLAAWFRRMRSLEVVQDDLEYVKAMALEKFGSAAMPYESEKIVWRGDRIEWLFARGFHAWWMVELEAGRAIVPSWL